VGLELVERELDHLGSGIDPDRRHELCRNRPDDDVADPAVGGVRGDADVERGEAPVDLTAFPLELGPPPRQRLAEIRARRKADP
jgi:hypothetical protein